MGKKALADACGNQFYVSLNFEILETSMPFYQNSFADRLEYELIFNDNCRVIVAKYDPGASYKIDNICLQFEAVTH